MKIYNKIRKPTPWEEDMKQTEGQNEEAQRQKDEGEAAGSQKHKKNTSSFYPSIWKKEQYEQFKSKNE